MADSGPAEPRPKQRRGFALLDPARLRAVSSSGGKALPAHLRSFAQNRDLASKAGALGGAASRGGGRPTASKNTHE